MIDGHISIVSNKHRMIHYVFVNTFTSNGAGFRYSWPAPRKSAHRRQSQFDSAYFSSMISSQFKHSDTCSTSPAQPNNSHLHLFVKSFKCYWSTKFKPPMPLNVYTVNWIFKRVTSLPGLAGPSLRSMSKKKQVRVWNHLWNLQLFSFISGKITSILWQMYEQKNTTYVRPLILYSLTLCNDMYVQVLQSW